jgi:hypothetical protein
VEQDVVVVLCDAVGDQAVDAAGGLRVQQDEETGDAVRRGDGLVVQQPAGDGPSLVLVVRAGGARPADRRGLDARWRVPAAHRPPDESRALLRVQGAWY